MVLTIELIGFFFSPLAESRSYRSLEVMNVNKNDLEIYLVLGDAYGSVASIQ